VAAKAAAKNPVVEDGSGETPEPETFTWKPKDGSDPIVLPHGSNAVPKDKHFWFAYQMNKRNFVGQVMFALECAGVSDTLQERIFALGDDEALELVNAWAVDVTGASVGES